MRCGYTWMAPYLHPPPSTQVTSVKQTCCLEPGHEGRCRSLSNVICPKVHPRHKLGTKRAF